LASLRGERGGGGAIAIAADAALPMLLRSRVLDPGGLVVPLVKMDRLDRALDRALGTGMLAGALGMHTPSLEQTLQMAVLCLTMSHKLAPPDVARLCAAVVTPPTTTAGEPEEEPEEPEEEPEEPAEEPEEPAEEPRDPPPQPGRRFEVEELVDRRTVDGLVQYRVKWVDHAKPTWQYAWVLQEDLGRRVFLDLLRRYRADA
jgi:hypothetical protein